MATSANAQNHDDISTSLNSIIEISERWLTSISRRQRQVRYAQALLTTILIWIGGFGVLLAIAGRDSLVDSTISFEFKLIVLATSLLVSGICGAAAFVALGRRPNQKLREISELIERTKAARSTQDDSGATASQGVAGNAILETDRMFELLPNLVRTRNQDSLLFGMVAFIVTALAIHGDEASPVAIVVGVAVWLYFRYEIRRTYERRDSNLEEQKKIFEQRKEEFLRNL